MKTRAELIEAAARTEASSASFGGWHSWENMPRDIQEVFLVSVENAIKAIESNGARVVPVEATWGLSEMSGAGADKLPSVEGVFGYAGQIACNVYTAMLSANPFKPE